MRFEGKIKSWNDARGFGFIEPQHGGQEIFVHINSFPSGADRPVAGMGVSFDVEVGLNGALLAQQWLRHKTVKPTFIVVYWTTVLANVAAFVWAACNLLL